MAICIYIIIIIITFFIIFKYYENIDNFKVSTNNTEHGIKDITEIYDYPNCIGCVTLDNKLKPNYIYNLADNRCIKNNEQYNSKTDLDMLINYDSLPSSIYNSCNNNYNSMYSSVRGGYIIIFRKDNIKMKISSISVHDRDITQPSYNGIIFSTNLEKKSDGSIIYPDQVLNSYESNITFESDGKLIISLDKNYNIGFINIKHNSLEDATTLNGAILIVATISDNDLIPDSARMVFYTIINNNNINRIIYTYNHLDPLQDGINEIIPITNTWQLPCDICSTSVGNLFKSHKYKSSNDIRCYKPLSDIINKTIFDHDIQDINNFGSCSQIYDTRYMPAKGAIIQILRNDGNDIGFKISQIQIYSDFNDNTYDLKSNTSLSALALTYLNNISLFDNVLDNDESSLLETTNNKNTKIHINLGSNYNISGISLKVPKSEQTNLIGVKIYIIKINDNDPFDLSLMKVTSVKIMTSIDVSTNFIESGDINSYTYLIAFNNHLEDPISQYTDLIINNEVFYDPNNIHLSTYKNGETYYQIPYTIYRTQNERRVLAKSKKDVSITINNIAASDAVTLFNIPSNDMTSIPGSNTSHILNPVTARYIQIIPSSIQTLDNTIQTINIYDMNKNYIKSNINPILIYTQPEPTYTNYLSNTSTGSIDKGIILIDIGRNVQITFIEILVSNISKLTNSIINLINENGYKVFTYTISNPQSITYIVTDNNLINVPGPNFLSKYSYPTCLNMNICNNIAPNTYYIMSDRCFKSKSVVGQCDNTCMSSLSNFTKINKTSMPEIDNNFDSCLFIRDTRFLPGPTLDDLSSNALNSLVGCYSLKLRLSSYTGPVIQIKRSTDNILKDFYSNKLGILNDNPNLNGIPLNNWLGTAIGYVTIWYDQSGKGNDATNTTNVNKLMYISIDSNGNYLLTGLSGAGLNFGYNKSPSMVSNFTGAKLFTAIIKVGSLRYRPTSGGANMMSIGSSSSGNGFTYGYYILMGTNSTYMANGSNILWINYNFGDMSRIENSTHTIKYDGFNLTSYINSNYFAKPALIKNILDVGNVVLNNKDTIGSSSSCNGDYYNIYLFTSSLSDADRNIAEIF